MTTATLSAPVDEHPAEQVAAPVDKHPAATCDAVHAAREAHDEAPTEGEHDDRPVAVVEDDHPAVLTAVAAKPLAKVADKSQATVSDAIPAVGGAHD